MAINNEPTIKPVTVTGIFTRYIAKTIPLAFDESMSYYECLCALLNYLNETIVPDINNVNDGLSELQSFYLELQNYVNTYFDNLDVQEEINNKLDEMALDGSLQEIISLYLNSNGIIVFNTLNDLKNATNLVEGSNVQILGKNSVNDGGIAQYKVITNDNYVIDNYYFIELQNDLIGVLITPDIYEQNITYEEHYDETSKTTYYITNIPMKNKYDVKNTLQLGLADDNYISIDSLESTIDFAKRKNASICINAGLYQRNTNINKPYGVFIKDGVILQNETTSQNWTILGIKEDGSFVGFPSNSTDAQTVLNAGCINALVGFGFIIQNGIALSGVSDLNPRQVLCKKTNGDYLIFTCDGRTKYDLGMNTTDIQRILANYNILDAFMLDGGGSTSTVIDLQKINKNIDNQYEDRKNNSFLYIAKTDIKNNDLNNSFALISFLRQEMIKRFITFTDVWSGYLKLYSDGLYPGVEFYPSNETEERAGKIWLNYNGLRVKNRIGTDEEEFDLLNVSSDFLTYLGNSFGEFYQHLTRPTDLNDITKSGLYFANSSTLNIPKAGNFLIIQTRTTSDTSNNKQQYAIPFHNSNAYIYTRRATDGSEGVYGDWEIISGYASGVTGSRPTNGKSGLCYFDTSLGKPIWYNGTNWVDATGTQV